MTVTKHLERWSVTMPGRLRGERGRDRRSEIEKGEVRKGGSGNEKGKEEERGDRKKRMMGRMRKGGSEKTSISLYLEPEVKYILSSTIRETSSHNIGHELGLILQQETACDQGAWCFTSEA